MMLRKDAISSHLSVSLNLRLSHTALQHQIEQDKATEKRKREKEYATVEGQGMHIHKK